MKKSLLMIAAAATLFAACSDIESLKKDVNESNGASNGAISFNAFTEKATKAENSDAYYTQKFFNHQESFQVWARKSNQPKQEIFDGTKVIVAEGTAANTYTYTYAPERFWDKLAPKYHFYAAAPARTTNDAWYWTFNSDDIEDAASLNAGYFSIEQDFTLNEVNLKHKDNGGADNKLESVFKNIKVSNTNASKDIDLLIAAPTEVNKTYYNVANPNAVNLNFIHILSKLNITIKTSLGTVTPTDGSADHTYDVKLLAFEVKNIPNVGTFSEDPNNLNTNNQQIRWTLTAPTAPATNTTSILTGIAGLNDQEQITTDALSVPYNPSEAQKLYIVESLIIPQEIKYQRIALDGGEHPAVNDATPLPFASYEAYEAAKHNDVDRLTEAQFNALITLDNNSKVVFVDWNTYKTTAMVPGEFITTITKTTFDERVVDATKEVAVPYTDYAEYSAAKGSNALLEDEDKFNALFDNEGEFVTLDAYNQALSSNISENDFNALVADATKETVEEPYSSFTEYSTAKGNNATLNEVQFNALIKDGAFVTWTYYQANAMVPGETNVTIDKDEFDLRVVEATESPATFIPAYAAPAEPYFTITYSIDGEIFTANYNLAAAFLGLDNNQYDENTQTQVITDKDEKFAFYEGWQNTLNIIINPTTIQFTADVAEWSSTPEASYEIENGNENR